GLERKRVASSNSSRSWREQGSLMFRIVREIIFGVALLAANGFLVWWIRRRFPWWTRRRATVGLTLAMVATTCVPLILDLWARTAPLWLLRLSGGILIWQLTVVTAAPFLLALEFWIGRRDRARAERSASPTTPARSDTV